MYVFLTPFFDIIKPLFVRSSFPFISIHLFHHLTFNLPAVIAYTLKIYERIHPNSRKTVMTEPPPPPSKPPTDNGWFQVNKDGSGDVLARPYFTEERIERVVTPSDRLVTGHLTIRLDAVLEAVELPAGVAHLDTGLADMDTEAFSLENTNAD